MRFMPPGTTSSPRGRLLAGSAVGVSVIAGAAGGCGVEKALPARIAGSSAGMTQPVPGAADALPGARVLVALERDGQVAVLGARPRWRVVRRVAVPAGPHNLAASAGLGLAAVTSPPADRVTVMNASGRIVARARVAGAPHAVAFVPGAAVLWVSAERANRLVALDPRSGRVLRRVATGGPPHDLAVSPDGRELWATIDRSSAVEVRSASTGRLLRRPVLGGAPHDIAFAPGGRRVWLSNFASGLLTVASAGGRRLAAVRAGTEPHHFAFGLGRLWASDNGGGVLLRIGPGSRRVLGRVRVGAAPHHVAIAAGDVLVAVNGTGRVAVAARSGRLRFTLPVGSGPHGIDNLPAP